MTPISGTARELACLALGHADADRAACPATDEQLVRDLTAEVQRLRSITGQHPEDGRERTTALATALGTTRRRAADVLDDLAATGWTIARNPQ